MPSSVLEPVPPSGARQFYRRQSKAHRSSARWLRFVFFALMCALAFGGWYLAKRGFGRQWRFRVVEELHKRGVEASVRRLTLDPFRGLVAQDVRIFDFKNRDNTVALISEILLDINYAALLHRQPFLNALDIRDAELTIPTPLAEPKTPKAQITRFRAHVYFPPEQIYVSQAEGMFCGVRIAATGQLIKRADYTPSGEISDEQWRQRMMLLQRLVDELRRCNFPAESPSLQVKFSGDLSQFEAARAEATLRAERLQRGAYEIKDVFVAAEWADQKLTVTHCDWSDHAGTFSGRSSWSRETNEADFQARSTLDAKQLLEAFGFPQLLADVAFTSPPLIELSGSGSLAEGAPHLSVIGRVAAGNFTYKAVPRVKVSGVFSWVGERPMLREVRIRHESGELTADLLDAPNDFRFNAEGAIEPPILGAIASPNVARFFTEWDWRRPPALRLAIRGPSRLSETWTGEGTLTLQRSRFRGAGLNSATANLRLGNGAITFENLHVARDEGTATGAVTYDFLKHEIRVSDLKATLHPPEAILWIEPKFFKFVTPYKFRQPPNIVANGVIHFQGGKNDHLEIEVDAPAGMEYVFLGKTLPFDRISGRLIFTDNHLQINGLEGGLFDGAVRGTADVTLGKNSAPYHANLSADSIDFPRLTDLYYKYETARGRLTGNYDWIATGSEARSMQGNGNVKVTDGNIFAIPVFGPLSGLLGAIIPGAGYSVARQAHATFAVRDGVIHTDDFKVAGKLFGMIGHGDLHFLEDKLDFDIRVDANGPGVLLTPMYKLFEYQGEGSLSKPNWHPKRF